MWWRVLAFLLAAVLGALAVVWIDASTWHRVRELEHEFAAVRTERFYHAVHLRVTIRELNDTLLRFHLKGEPRDLAQFRTQAESLQRWLAARKTEVTSPEERTLFTQLESAYDQYLRGSAELQKRTGSVFGVRKQLDELNEKLRQCAAPFLELCEALMQTQRLEFGAFLKGSERTLDSLQRLIKLSLVLLVVLAALLIVLVYRGMIRPLWRQLSASRVIIERQEKLAALGGLAAGVAHEIRNPLTAIKFRLFSLNRTLPAAAGNEDLGVIAGEINRLERIVKDFLQFARPSEPEMVPVPAARILEEVRELLRPQLEKAAIALNLEAKDDLWLRADTHQIKQALINLVQNAAESIGQQGVIVLRAVSGHAPLAGHTQAVVVIEVADTGKGIPPEVQQRLFDPFFTTKDGGTGLGLPIAARIVEKHGGDLRYQTQIHRGTTFQVMLPRVPENESPTPAH